MSNNKLTKYNSRKVTTDGTILEEVNFEINENNNNVFFIKLAASVVLFFSIAIYIRADVSVEIVLDYLFTNKPQTEQRVKNQGS